MCRSSGRGCTVIPCAPKASQSFAVFNTLGILPPLALRSVAILLMFTLKFVIVLFYAVKMNFIFCSTNLVVFGELLGYKSKKDSK